MTSEEILSNAFVVTGGGPRLDQFRSAMSAVGIDPSLVRTWQECRIDADGSMGNAVSQYSLVRYAKETGMPFLVVFEDDAVPSDTAKDDIVKAFDTRPDDCLCLSLGWTYSDPPQKDDIARRSDCNICYGSHAYVLFGDRAYDAYMEQWAKNGRADVCISRMEGSYKGMEPIFAQSTFDRSIHLPDSWLADATEEQAIDGTQARRFTLAKKASDEVRAKNAVYVAYTVDVQGNGASQFCDQLLVSIYSLLSTKRPHDDIRIIVFYNAIPAEIVTKVMGLASDGFSIRFVKLAGSLMGQLNECSRRDPKQNIRVFSGITFARFCLPELLPEIDKVVYLDADTLSRAPIRELYDTELGENDLIGAPYGIVPEYGFYSGTIVMNLASMRKSNATRKFLDYARKEAYRFYLPDQTAMNRFFNGCIKRIDSSWIFPPTPGEHRPELATAKMWHFYNGPKPYRLNTDDAGDALVHWNNVLVDAERKANG